MVTRDVLKVLKLHSPTARAILRTFKTSLVPINHEMHSRSYDFLYILRNTRLNNTIVALLSCNVSVFESCFGEGRGENFFKKKRAY